MQTVTSVRGPIQKTTGTTRNRPPVTELAARCAAIAADHAEDVDARGRFPQESLAAIREAGLLGATVPARLGGLGLAPAEAVAVVRALGAACGSTGLVYAMHLSQVACLVAAAVDGSAGDPARELLTEIARDGLLVGSATTERGVGGDVTRSLCHVDRSGERIVLVKDAPVVSYGEFADVVLVTARRTPDSVATDQVLVMCRRADLTLTRTSTWDAMGFRGTESHGYLLEAVVTPECVLAVPYADLSARAMLPASHLFWSAAWLGLSDAALGRARTMVRTLARVGGDPAAVASLRLAELTSTCIQLEHTVRAAIDYVESPESDATLTAGLEMSAIKVNASELVVDAAMQALRICGLAAYQRGGQASLDRVVRDALGAPLMINNDRILSSCAVLSLAARGPR